MKMQKSGRILTQHFSEVDMNIGLLFGTARGLNLKFNDPKTRRYELLDLLITLFSMAFLIYKLVKKIKNGASPFFKKE
jgi:hypothetical protein